MAYLPPSLINSIGYRIQFDILRKFEQRVAAGTKGLANGVVAAAAAWADNMGDPDDMLRIHSDVAKQVIEEVVGEYDRTVAARKKVPSYRIGDRYSGGALRRALESPSMAVPSPQGIAYVDQDLLNQEAKHWMRLNFGAGAGGGPSPGRFPFQFDQRHVFDLRFRTGPREAFHLPVGMFVDAEGKRVGRSDARRGLDRFFPLKREFLPNPTRGIEARQFLDAGLRVMVEELPGRYRRQMNEWFAAGNKAGQRYYNSLRPIGPRGPRSPRS